MKARVRPLTIEQKCSIRAAYGEATATERHNLIDIAIIIRIAINLRDVQSAKLLVTTDECRRTEFGDVVRVGSEHGRVELDDKLRTASAHHGSVQANNIAIVKLSIPFVGGYVVGFTVHIKANNSIRLIDTKEIIIVSDVGQWPVTGTVVFVACV